MRIAVHHPDGAVSAYKFGRIEDGVHNEHPIFGSMPIEEFVRKVVNQAQDEYPECDIVVEHMVLNPDYDPESEDTHAQEESVWVADHEFDPELHEPTPAGNQVSGAALAANVSQEAQ